jgi:plasmid stabilization system protein ParE
VPEVPADTGTSPDVTPADGVSLEDDESAVPLGDATDPRIPFRWVETVEMLLEQGRSEVQREEAVTRLTPAEGVLLLTARKTAPPETRAPAPHDLDDDDDVRTVSIQASRLVEELRRAGPPATTQIVPNLPSHAQTVMERPGSGRMRAQLEPPVEVERPRTGSGRIPAQVVSPVEVERPRTGSGRIPAQVEPPPEVLERPRTDSGRMRAPLQTPSEPIELRLPSSAPKSNSRPPAGNEPAAQAEPWESVVRAPSETTQRREALKLVPDVAQVHVAAPPPSERSEDGLIPSALLDRKLTDMAVLLRYGHEPQVRNELDQLRSRYPQDLLLARRIAEFYLTNERPALALEQLFSLATGLFERRNVEGMKQALGQVLVIDPNNERASRLLGLLEQRPSDPPPDRKPR